MKKKKLYILAIISVIIISLTFFSKYEKGVVLELGERTDLLTGDGTLAFNKIISLIISKNDIFRIGNLTSF